MTGDVCIDAGAEKIGDAFEIETVAVVLGGPLYSWNFITLAGDAFGVVTGDFNTGFLDFDEAFDKVDRDVEFFVPPVLVDPPETDLDPPVRATNFEGRIVESRF